MTMVLVAALGRVLVQFGISGTHPHIAVPCCLRPHPPSIRFFASGAARVLAVAQQLADRDELLVEVCDGLDQTQLHYKACYDKEH
jgi:hypothetical protein